MAEILHEHEIRHAHLFCGLGGGARGFNQGSARVGNLVAKFRCIGGIDVDPASIRDFERLAGVPGKVLDLFSLEQYVAFHGKQPPPGWRDAMPDDIRAAFGYEFPDLVFLSAPCKGFSGLLAEKQAKTEKYQALNGLTLRGMFLMLEAFKDDPPSLVLFENVPRIATRGKYLLDQIEGLLRGYGYAVVGQPHNCGEIGELAQSRERYLLVARYDPKIKPYVYEPPKRALRGVGEVLDRMPLPGDQVRGGPMHRVPALQWRTWVRLAFVEAGKDWRSLNDLRVEDGILRDFAIEPVGGLPGPVDRPHGVTTQEGAGHLGVHAWTDTMGTVTGDARPSKGAFAVGDPRSEMWGSGQAGVTKWEDPAPTVTSARSPLQNRGAVADPRPQGEVNQTYGQYGVKDWRETAATVTSQALPGGGPNSVADPRMGDRTPFNHVFRIVPAGEPAQAIHGAGGYVADPRGDENRHVNGKYRITGYDEPANAVIAASTTGNGACAVADPRLAREARDAHLGVLPFDEPAGTITGNAEPTTGRFAVADPRPTHGPNAHTNKHKVVGYEHPTPTVTGSDRVGSGALSVADPRMGETDYVKTKYQVTPYDGSTRAVIGASTAGDGAYAVADPRPNMDPKREAYRTQGHYGVLGWEQHAWSVTGYGQADNGRWSIADKRVDLLPGLAEQLVCVIIARDGTWHRPFTTLELAALQSLYDPEDVLELDGKSDSAWRERIGNAVPSAAAKAMADVFGDCILRSIAGESFRLSNESIWVRQLQIGLSVDLSGQVHEATA